MINILRNLRKNGPKWHKKHAQNHRLQKIYDQIAGYAKSCNFVTEARGVLWYLLKYQIIFLLTFVLSCAAPSEGYTVGQKVVVQFQTTWKDQQQWVVKSYDKEMLQLVSTSQMNYVDPHVAGEVPATSTITFLTLKPGESVVEFCRQRIWGGSCLETVSKTITCR